MKTLNANELKEYFRNHMNIDVVEIGDQAYACTHWNGEEWNDCWQVDENFNYTNECKIGHNLFKSIVEVEDEKENTRTCKMSDIKENETIIETITVKFEVL